MEKNVDTSAFLVRLKQYEKHKHPYRRCVLLSELQTPCCPVVCKMIVPDPLMIEQISKIQKKLFLCISYSSVLPCMGMLEEFNKQSGTDSKLKPFVDYKDAITLLTFNTFFYECSKIENGEFVFYVDSGKFTLDQHTCKRIVDLINPSIAIIPCESLKLVEWSSWGLKKTQRMNRQYEYYYYSLIESRCPNLVKTVHDVLDFKDSFDLPGIDYSGLGFGESLIERGAMIKQLTKTGEKDKLRVLQLSTGTPLEILHAIMLGIDVVVTAYPELLAMNGRAIWFKIPEDLTCEYDYDEVLIMLEQRCRFEDGVYEDLTNAYIDLNEGVYSQQFEERLHEYSIMNESRAYVNHLLVCEEMSANLILSSHNLGMYELLFQKIRDSIENNTFVGFVYNFIKSNVK